MTDTYNSLGKFNRLYKRPDPLLPETQITENDLIAAFPFLFKPNRSLALHPDKKQISTAFDPGWPFKAKAKHWMMMLQIPDTLGLSYCLITLSEYGHFLLWRYQGERNSGIYPINIVNADDAPESINCLHLQEQNKAISLSKITLIRITQQFDEENLLHNIRIETPHSIFKIELQLLSFIAPWDKPIVYHYYRDQQKETSINLLQYHQIGGWGGGVKYYWNDLQNELRQGNPTRPITEQYIPFNAHVAEYDTNALLVAGDSTKISVFYKNKTEIETCSLKSHVFSLAIVATKRYVLAGSDDHKLYILDWQGKIQQKVMMGGIVEGILVLDFLSDEWIDIAVLVRNKGLYCCRLFVDCFADRNKLLDNQQRYRQAVKEQLTETSLEHWFSTQNYKKQQLMALTLLSSETLNKEITDFFKKRDIFRHIQYPVIEFWVHILHRGIFKCIKKDSLERESLSCFIALLKNIALGPERARIAVRELEGWLQSLLLGPEKVNLIDDFQRLLPDAKRLLRHYALTITQEKEVNQVEKYLGYYVSIYCRLKFDRYYNELIMGDGEKNGPVSAVAMIDTAGHVALVRVNRDDDRLQAFYLKATNAIINPHIDEKNWHHSLLQDDTLVSSIHALLPIDDEHLLVVANSAIGIAFKGEERVHWSSGKSIKCAAINKKYIAVSGFSRLQPVSLFEINGCRLIHQFDLSISDEVEPQNVIQELIWDDAENLWGVTSGVGYLLKWSEPLISRKSAKIIKKFNTSQYSLIVYQHCIICGGEDGVVRAYHMLTGDLLWNFIAAGAIQSMRVLPKNHLTPVIAVLSKEEHLYTLNANGQQYGLLYIPKRHLLSLSCCKMHPEGAVHFFIGTLEGDVRLIEAVPENWSHTSYLKGVDDSFGKGLDWIEIGNNLDEQIKKLNKFDKLQDWCSLPLATEEPMRCVWAAQQLISTFYDYTTVINMLREFKGNFDPDIVKLRAHTFAYLVSKLTQLSSENKKYLLQLCDDARDGAFASMVMRIPDGKGDIFELLQPTIIKKITSALPFTSAALLHLFHSDGWNKQLERVLIALLEKHSSQDLHEGMLSGLLCIIFRKLTIVSNNNTIICKLACLGDVFPLLAEKLLKAQNHLQFFQWLNQWGALIFNDNDRVSWNKLFPYFNFTNPTEIDFLSFKQAIVSTKSKDSFYVGQMIEVIHQGDNLPKEWQAWKILASEIEEKRYKILYQSLMPRNILLEIQQAQNLLAEFKANIALFYPLQLAWKSFITDGLSELKKDQINLPKTSYLKVSHDTLWVVEDEAAPLLLQLTNQGPEDIVERIQFGLDNSSQHLVNNKRPMKTDGATLACHKKGLLGESLKLELTLLPPFESVIELKLFWFVGKEGHKETLQIRPVPRWTKYGELFPNQDKLAYHLLSRKENNQYKYQRLIIKRITTPITQFIDRKMLIDMINNWVERSGRLQMLNLLTPEPVWEGIKVFSKKSWLTRLKGKPTGLEIWLVDDAIHWDLTFLEAIEKASNTALFLPDLVVSDSDNQAEMFELLDQLLYLHSDNQLNILQWALKACTQSIREIPNHIAPTFLGRGVWHGKEIKRGEIPPDSWWSIKNQICPIVGINHAQDEAALPPDPVKPLSIFINNIAFKHLFRMGLVNYVGQEYWIPRAKLLIDYADSIYPTKTMNQENNIKIPLTWKNIDWSDQEIDFARNILFGKRHRPLNFPPYQGFHFNEWNKISEYAGSHVLPEAFIKLIGISGRNEFNHILASQRNWHKLMFGDEQALTSLIQRLKNDQIKVTKQTPDKEPYWLIWLTIENQMSRFNKLILIIPKDDFIEKYGDDKRMAVNALMSRIKNNIKASDAIILLVFDWPSEMDYQVKIGELELVFLNSRQITWLMACHSPTDTLTKIVKSQISYSSLSQSIFKSKGPVSPSRFFGRKLELDILNHGLDAGKSFVLTGPRSIGKSSLLLYFCSSAYWKPHMQERYFPIFLDLQDQRIGLNYGRFFCQLLKIIPRKKDELVILAKDLRNMSTAYQKHRITNLFDDIFEHIVGYAGVRKPLFLLDEADEFYQYDKECGEILFTLFRKVYAEKKALFIIASYPEKADSLAKEMINMNHQSFNFLEKVELNILKDNEVTELVRTGMDEVGIACNKQQCDAIVANSFQIPSLIQATCCELCIELDKQIAQADGDELNQVLIDKVIYSSQRDFLNSFFSQVIAEVKIMILGLVYEGNYSFTLQQGIDAAKHYLDNIDSAQVENHIKDLLRTLILAVDKDRYFFSGDPPIFPTAVLNVYGKEELENVILHEMENSDGK